jgi:hypothetical protein
MKLLKFFEPIIQEVSESLGTWYLVLTIYYKM